MLERYEPGVKAVFARNPTYHARGLPYLDKVEWLFVKDRSTQLSLFRAGQVDLPFYDARIPRADVASFKKSNPDYPVVFWDWLAVRTLAMRTDKAALQRRARAPRASAWRWTGRSGWPSTSTGEGAEDSRAGAGADAASGSWPRGELGEGAR